MIDRSQEQLLSVAEAVKLCPSGRGEQISIQTMHRWMTAGLDGIKLEYVQCGGRHRRTSAKAIDRFFARLTEARAQLVSA